MNEEEVIRKIGKENWKDFQEFMTGQTVGVNDDGTLDYYECDVDRFPIFKVKKFSNAIDDAGLRGTKF